MGFCARPVHEVDNVGILQLLHHQDLVDDELFLRLLLQVNLLDGHLWSRHSTVNVSTRVT